MISDRYGGEMGNVVKANTREKVPSDGPKREPEGRSLQHSASDRSLSIVLCK